MSGRHQSYPALPVITRGLSLSAEARGRLAPDLAPQAYLETLRERGLYADGIQVLPQLLDKPRAVWWACLCCWDALRGQADAELAEVLDDALHWLFEPSEENRLRLTPEAIATDTPAGCLRMAVVWSAGSLADPDLPVVPPPPQLTARLAAAAVLLAAAQVRPELMLDAHRHYLHLGFDVLEGGLSWLDEQDRPADERIEVA